jgi:hypothetical protein
MLLKPSKCLLYKYKLVWPLHGWMRISKTFKFANLGRCCILNSHSKMTLSKYKTNNRINNNWKAYNSSWQIMSHNNKHKLKSKSKTISNSIKFHFYRKSHMYIFKKTSHIQTSHVQTLCDLVKSNKAKSNDCTSPNAVMHFFEPQHLL